MPAPDRAARAVALLLLVQFSIAAGALAGPWALRPAAALPPPTAGTAVAPASDVTSTRVLLSAPGLWRGAVPVAPLSLTARRVLSVPRTAQGLGWWADGPRPGAVGAAVVVGHVDLDGRAGVFTRLAGARIGSVVVVGDGAQRVQYRVVAVERFAKAAFPTDRVYRPSHRRELRLVTCGGAFDRTTGHYRDNVVVTAVADGTPA